MVSLRGPARKPSSSSGSSHAEPDHGLAVDLLQRQAADPAAPDGVGERRDGRAEPLVVVGHEHLQALAAALDVEHRLGAGQHDVGAGLARRGARRRSGLRPLQRGAVRLRGVGGGEDDGRRRVVVALRAQALGRARQRELRAAEALDEVAALADADRLQRDERVVQGGEAAGDALGQHVLARDDAVALEQQLGLRAAAPRGVAPRRRRTAAR